ncbi:enoyl-CoA hydratase/isomerase family protein [Thalassorhabdomicrobium marinisediminis]|uniref:3-hydroxyisobutyryl-CoA hydrolase n=1 Tax=Thalassorhabdomicrobium marinisediminis TaxID=2170577 RepID=A0A2T7G1K1_9RHOB|nr:enoyl-CoA hydratase/isomerase family protein [Thalassorhabdomicrobium marinisediminis]PVA08287.1 enoyl-CoA hydratase [Thalassorhabdomicrobium marinisediminis]
MSDITIRTEGRAGRITLNRPKALNALTHGMCNTIEHALDRWRDDPEVALIVIDGAGDKAFCAGGDIQKLYDAGRAGDFDYARQFWRDEYRMNAKLANFPKPIVAFLHGFTMGGGVGVGCHGSHRVVCADSQIAMPEVSIGLVPDVGGSLLLARAPGRIGEYIGLTADRMDAADAIYAGFADHYIPRDDWPALIDTLCRTGDAGQIEEFAQTPPRARLADWQADIDTLFAGESFGDICRTLDQQTKTSPAHAQADKLMPRHSPLSQWATVALIHAARAADTVEAALTHEFRFTSRAMEHGDFLEGVRAAIIDRDRSPTWQHASWQDVTEALLARMSAPVTPPLDLISKAKGLHA